MLLFFLYQIIFPLLLPLIIIRLFVKSLYNKNYRKRLLERFAIIPSIVVDKPLIWLHCVSIGEFLASIAIIEQILANNKYQLLITTTTATGSSEVIKRYHNKVIHYYIPFDVGYFIQKFINKLQPKICIIMETEIWPNLINTLSKNNIAIILANARLSDRSCKKYQIFSKFSKLIINKITVLAVQNQHTLDNFKSLNISNNKMLITGNIKFDIDNKNLPNLQELTKICNNRPIILLASTHKGENELIINEYLKHKNNLKDALIVIAPRHIERVKSITNILEKNQLMYIKRTAKQIVPDNINILILDSLGELISLYKLCTITFIGGSLIAKGGHNMLEACVFKKCIIYGKNMQNFPSLAKELLALNGAIEVKDSKQLWQTIINLYNNKDKQQQLANNAYVFFNSNKGASDKILQLIIKYINPV